MSKKVLSTGIDVSYAQGKIDWSKVKGEIGFAILRCGFGGDYTNQDDSQWLNNVKGCEQYGIPYGVYLYSYATDVNKAKSEAEHVIRLLKGHKPDLPVFLDIEEQRIANLGKAKILEIAKTFCYYIEKAGYNYGTYCNTSWYNAYLTDSWYDNRTKWLAQYNNVVTYKGKYDIWQYTSKGKISGINGNVDMNYSYVSFASGDVNEDGKVTAADARDALRGSAGLTELTEKQKKAADMNGDGQITAADAREILRNSAGLKEKG